MKDCEWFRGLMAEALLGDLAPSDRASLESHIAACPACAAEYGAMRSTLRIMDERERPDPGPAFWDGYWDRLADRLEKETPAPRLAARWWARWWKRLTAPRRTLPRWVFQTAAALLLVGAGVLIGRLALFPPGSSRKPAGGEAATPLISTTASDPLTRARSYLDRSKLVILALVNYDPATEDAYALDLPLQKAIARELVDQAGPLQADLKDPRERRLRELVSDLETILIQIANLDSENDLEAVEFVKLGAATRGVLLKINLSEMDGKTKPENNRRIQDRPGTAKSSA
jgi:hypothetical protein